MCVLFVSSLLLLSSSSSSSSVVLGDDAMREKLDDDDQSVDFALRFFVSSTHNFFFLISFSEDEINCGVTFCPKP